MLKLRSLCVIAAAAALAVPAASVFAGGCDSFRGSVSINVGGGYFHGGFTSRDHYAPRVVHRHYVAPRPCYDRPVVRHVKVIRHGGHHGGYYGHKHGYRSRGRGHCD